MNNRNGPIVLTIAILSIVCFTQFCAIIWVVMKGQSFSLPDLSYSDFLTVIFTAVTLILSMLAVMIGVLAFIGWQGFHSNVHRLTQSLIRDGFDEGGEFREVLKEEVESIATSGISPIYGDEEQEEND